MVANATILGIHFTKKFQDREVTIQNVVA